MSLIVIYVVRLVSDLPLIIYNGIMLRIVVTHPKDNDIM